MIRKVRILQYNKFYFTNIHFSLSSGELSLEYAVDDVYKFQEKMFFPKAPFVLSSKQQQALGQVLQYLHIAAGISYYKAFLPHDLVLDIYPINKSEADFFNRFYINGLGEFAVRNHLHPFKNINFPYREDLQRKVTDLDFAEAALVPIGGGKDSCLAAELLKKNGVDVTAVACGNPRPITEVIKLSGMDEIIIKRQIDPLLIELNQKGEVYNGHVPITGILAFVLWISAILYDKKYVVMSCERSASSGNMTYDGVKINHQYSKSLDFEKDFYNLTQTITPQFRYFSLLRPLSELNIARLFVQNCVKYFDVFTSCNKAFKLDEKKRLNHWCGNCDKCRFVFLILAPFMDKQKLLDIVGSNPLDDASQLEDYEKLLGLKGHKPFECVGEFKESNWAMCQLSQMPQWRNDYIVKTIAAKKYAQSDDLFALSHKHLIPKRFKNVMAEFRK